MSAPLPTPHHLFVHGGGHQTIDRILIHTIQHTSGNKKMEDDAAKDTDKKIAENKKLGKDKGKKVVDDLLKAVMEVKPEVPDNLKSS